MEVTIKKEATHTYRFDREKKEGIEANIDNDFIIEYEQVLKVLADYNRRIEQLFE